MRRVGVAAAACLLVGLAVGCGAAREDGRDGGATGATGTAVDAGALAGAAAISEVTIEAPFDGGRLQARPTAGGALRAPVRVRGRAPAGATVVLNAGCRPQPCRAHAATDADGRWAVTMVLVVSRAARFVTIDAGAQRSDAALGPAVATVELVERTRAAPEERRAAPSSAPSGGGSSSSAPSGGGSSSSAPPGSSSSSSRSGGRTPAPAGAGSARPGLPRDVLVIGDSLAIGMAEPLRAALPGWHVRTDGRIGRPLAEGMQILAGQPSPPAILAFSLFTNDLPRSTRALEAAVRTTATRPDGCVVWSTIAAPPYRGVSYAAANALLRELARDSQLTASLVLVDWAAAVARSPALIEDDEVHATPAGYRTRAQLYAEAIRSCAGEG